jgi:hypothetical protein
MLRTGALRCMMMAAIAAAAGARPAFADPINIPTQIDPFELYGDEMQFDVLRDGDPIGSYLVFFRKSGDALQVETRASIEVDVLFASAYRLRYQSLETWRDGALDSLTASTNDDGEFKHMEAVRDGASLEVSGMEGAWDAAPTILPTSHWNMAQIAADTLINTVSGSANHISVAEAGIETVPMGAESQPARRFVYSGDLDMEAWYDDQGRWVKLRFAAEDGSTIEYVCRRCSAPTRLTEAE